MRVGVIRGDMPGPVFLADLEDVSQWNPSTEPRGQERYLSRPDLTLVGAALSANVPASRKGTIDLAGALPITVVLGASDVLQIRVDPLAGYTSCTVAAAAYPSIATFLVAVNAAIAASAMKGLVTASVDETGHYFVLRTTAKGTGAYLGVNVLATSTLNTLVGFANPAFAFTVPTAATVISTTLPVGGPLDVRLVTLGTLLGGGTTTAERNAVADTIAPRFIETEVVIKSFQVGYLADLRNALFNPDPNRLPAIANGPAITCTLDDGWTVYTAPLTAITNGQIGVPLANWVTITGTDLGHAERPEDTEVHFLDESNLPTQQLPVILWGKHIIAHGGSIAPLSITIPPALKPTWVAATTTKVRVKYTSFASNKFPLV